MDKRLEYAGGEGNQEIYIKPEWRERERERERGVEGVVEGGHVREGRAVEKRKTRPTEREGWREGEREREREWGRGGADRQKRTRQWRK